MYTMRNTCHRGALTTRMDSPDSQDDFILEYGGFRHPWYATQRKFRRTIFFGQHQLNTLKVSWRPSWTHVRQEESADRTCSS